MNNNTSTIPSSNATKLHPHKFLMWVAIASICMMFAALTSAYIVKKNSDNFISIALPSLFYTSTVVILISSATMNWAVKHIKAGNTASYKTMLGVTAVLGVAFAAIQIMGFKNLEAHGIQLVGFKSNPAASFLLVIIGLHMVHVLGGVIGLLALYFRPLFKKETPTAIAAEIVATYWHFVDILWIYLLIFLLFIR